MRALKITLVIVLIPLLLIGALILAIPHLVNVDNYGGKVLAEVEHSIGRKITVGQMKLSLFPLALRVEQLAVSEDPAFGSGNFATMDEMRIEIGLLPLLNRRVQVEIIEARTPNIKLIKNAKGQWNIDSLLTANAAAKNAPGVSGGAGGAVVGATMLQISKLRLKDGTMSIEDQSVPLPKVRAYDHVNMTLENLAEGKPFDFLLSAKVGAAEIETSGTAGPMRPGPGPNDPAEMPAQAHVKLTDVNLADYSDPKSNIQGLLSGIIEIDSDGRTAKVTGTSKVEKLHASAKGHAASIPVDAKFDAQYVPLTETLTLTSLTATIGNASATVTGVIHEKDPAQNVLNVSADKASLAEIGKLLPALGVVLPSGSSFASGSLTNSGKFTGSFEPLNGTLALDVQNARLSGFSVADRVSSVAKFAGLPSGKDTEIQQLKCNATFTHGAATFSGIELVVPGMTVTGSGTMSAAGQLELKMTAAMTGSAAGAQVMKLISGSKGVPFYVRGTAENPQFIPDVAGLASQQLTSRLPGAAGGSVGKILGGLLGKKN